MLQYLHTDFEYWVENALNIDLGITIDPNVTPKISIGDTVWLEKAGLATYAEENVVDDGYFIKRVGDTIFIDGINDRGVIYGAYGFLEKYLGYTFINNENDSAEYLFDANVASSFKVENVDEVIVNPYFATRHYMQTDTMYGYTNQKTMIYQHNNGSMAIYQTGFGGLNCVSRLTGELDSNGEVITDISTGNIYHSMHETYTVGVAKYNYDNGTSIAYSDYATLKEVPAAYTSYYQPCFSSGVTKDVNSSVNAAKLCAYSLKELIKQRYDFGVRMFSFSVNDTDADAGYLPYCTCSDCVSALGTDANLKAQRTTVMVINFINAVIAEIEKDSSFMARYPDFKIYTLAYAFSNTCPTNYDVKFDDRVCLQVCNETMEDYSRPITDSVNDVARNNILAWKDKLGENSEMFILHYNVYGHMPLYWPTLSTNILDNIKWYHDNGVSALDIEGEWGAGNKYWEDKLYAYIYSRLMYEFDETKYVTDKSAYLNELVDEYLRAYYGNSWEAVKDIVWTYQGYYDSVYSASNEHLKLFGGEKISKQLTLSQLQTLEDKINSAISAQSDSTIILRLKEIKISIQAAILVGYDDYYPYDIWGSGYKNAAKAFKELCAEVGVTMWSGVYTIEDYVDNYLP
ncbi:MAG: DUF4838 domain-containing protein [Clostridiales bacterium]|nr:DUF4838 domain-containing protein [Clostridiales bacterium]